MLCATQTAAYICSNATGTTCTKVAVKLAVIDATQVLPCGVNSIIVSSKAEWDMVSSYSSFTDLSAADAGSVSLSIMMIWAVGWAFRMVIKAINSASEPASSGGD
jgi:hypothetical protein